MKKVIISLSIVILSACGSTSKNVVSPGVDSAVHAVIADSTVRRLGNMGLDELRRYLDSKGVSYTQQATAEQLARIALEIAKNSK